jgi:hypothetical protein
MIEKINQAIAKLKAKLSATVEEIKLSQVETEETGLVEIAEDGTTSAPDGIYTVKDGAGVKIEVKDGVATITEPVAEEVKGEVKQEEVKEDKSSEPYADAEKVAELEAKVAELEKELADEKAKNTELSAEKTKVETKLSEVSKQPAGKRLVMSAAEDAKPLTEKEKRVQARLAQHKASLQ